MLIKIEKLTYERTTGLLALNFFDLRVLTKEGTDS